MDAAGVRGGWGQGVAEVGWDTGAVGNDDRVANQRRALSWGPVRHRWARWSCSAEELLLVNQTGHRLASDYRACCQVRVASQIKTNGKPLSAPSTTWG